MIAAGSPRWRKVIGDARVTRGRLLLLLTAMLLSIATVTALLASGAVLRRELSRSYLESRPASAILHMDPVDAETVALAREWPGIGAAEAAGVTTAKLQLASGEWLPLTLTVVADFEALRIDLITHVSGTWPPPRGSLLIERSGLDLLDPAVRSLSVESPNGARRAMPIAGLVHDQTRPPSTQEMTIYGYITPETMQLLNPDGRLDRLKILVRQEQPSAEDIEAVVRPLGVALRQRGHWVRSIEIPPPGEHPHQWQYETISILLLTFSLLGLVLESTLLAIVVNGLLASQVRQIGVMKAIGARTRHIAAMYASLVGATAAIATGLGVPLGMLLGGTLVDFVAGIVNVAIQSHAVSSWIVVLCVALGLAAPLVATVVPVLAASRRTIKEAIDDHGAASGASTYRSERWAVRLGFTNEVILAAVRNTLRRRVRFALAVTLLTLAGIVFLVGGNLASTWQNVSEAARQQRHFDLHVVLRTPEPREQLARLARIPGVRHAETADALTAYVDRGDALPIAGLGRNALQVRFLPSATNMLSPSVVEGRWLRHDDVNAIVLNSVALERVFPRARVGEHIDLLLNARAIRVQIVGIVAESLSGGTGYATTGLYDAVADAPGTSQSVRIALAAGYSTREVSDRLETVFEGAGSPIRYIASTETMNRAEDEHVYVIIALLGLIAAAIAIVGAAGLASALGTSVIERTRELGVARAIGARSAHIYKSVITEAALVGASSWSLALALSVPATLFIVAALRGMLLQPLPTEWSLIAPTAWLVATSIVAAIASLLPARRAARMSVGEALGRV